MPLKIDIARTLDAVDALAADWTALEGATPEATGFQSFDWCRAWLAAARERKAAEPRVIAIRDGGHLVMLAPIQVETISGIKIARWIGAPLTQYGDFLALPSERRRDWHAAAEVELARWRDIHLFAFTGLRCDSVLAQNSSVMDDDMELQSAPFVHLNKPAGKPRRHKSLERRFKRLAAFGPLRFEALDNAERRVVAAKTAFVMKREWLRRQHRVSLTLANPVTAKSVAELCAIEFLSVHCLWAGDELAAIEIGFVGGGVYRSLIGCFNARLATGSPGHYLTLALQRQLAAQGIVKLDFLAPSDAYKMMFADGVVSVGARYKAQGLRGQLALFFFVKLRPTLKQLLNQVVALRRILRAENIRSSPLQPATRRGLPFWRPPLVDARLAPQAALEMPPPRPGR